MSKNEFYKLDIEDVVLKINGIERVLTLVTDDEKENNDVLFLLLEDLEQVKKKLELIIK